jgi:hypothetical protein
MPGIGHNHPVVTIESLSTSDKAKIKKAMSEMNDSYTRVASEQQLQKDILEEIQDSVGLEKKLIRKIARAYYKADFDDEVAANDEFAEMYTGILKSPVNLANNNSTVEETNE